MDLGLYKIAFVLVASMSKGFCFVLFNLFKVLEVPLLCLL